MKVVSVVGARPQFIKAAPVSRALRRRNDEVLVHTGQHYDPNLSAAFFDELEIPEPDHNLGVGSGAHGAQTGTMLARIEEVLLEERPDRVLVYGDTNSTLAGSLAAAKLGMHLTHVEAGLRSHRRTMPEEVNRVVTDHLSDLLLCPTGQAAENLSREGITRGVHVVGDVMADALDSALARLEARPGVLGRFALDRDDYYLATVHRAGNTDNRERLGGILAALQRLDRKVVFPMHPRTRAAIERFELAMPAPPVVVAEPLGYLDTVALESHARVILTDSGGIQKEACWLGIPCVTLREETEWTETVAHGWNVLAGADPDRIVSAVRSARRPAGEKRLFGDGRAAERCVALMEEPVDAD